ncbi:hypothetical protein B0H19DRAFT_1225634 [Mycena capillaripes]|nr:hypothetical protein B0H19DRAFT_1225634 [Mycena capillaripes]
METAILSAQIVAPTLDSAHDRAAQIMSLLPAEAHISEEDRRLLQDLYHRLEQRHVLLSQGAEISLMERDDDDEEEDGPDYILDAELEKAAQFPTFLESLDPADEAAKLLIEGSSRVLTALQTVENEASVLANVPMQKVLEMYEKLKSHEERLEAGGAPVSLVNARIYSSETVAFEKIVKAMILMDMKAPNVEEVSAQM